MEDLEIIATTLTAALITTPFIVAGTLLTYGYFAGRRRAYGLENGMAGLKETWYVMSRVSVTDLYRMSRGQTNHPSVKRHMRHLAHYTPVELPPSLRN